MRVRFRDKWRDVFLDLPTAPLLTPSGVVVSSHTNEELLYGPDLSSSVADPITGDLPLVHFADDRLQVEHLAIPPPAPLSLQSVQEMWQEVLTSGVPLPSGVATQGRLLHGQASGETTLLPELLDRAHAAARALLSRWPQEATPTSAWRAVELPGGREDLRGTDRATKNITGFQTRDGRCLPVKTLRRVHGASPWTARLLQQASMRLAQEVGLVADHLGHRDRSALLRPFLQVAQQATGNPLMIDAPLSGWPVPLRQAYEAFQAALMALQPTASHNRRPLAPLCYLWRLYEAWAAVRCIRVIDGLAGYTRVLGPQPVEDAEWLVKWVSSDGTTLTALAQARIGRQATRFGGAIPVGVRSVSSDLRPDLLLACEVAGTVRMSVVDAKRRSSEVMNASAAAEAGSKYLWGLRTVSGDGTSAVVSLKGVVLATTATPPKLHDAAARIVGARLVPGENDDAFTKSIATALTQPEADD